MNFQFKQRGFIGFGQFIRDIRFAIRMLRKNPGFTALALLTLGLGIGASSTMFGVFNELVLNPVPYPEPERMVYIWSNYRPGFHQPLSVPDFKDIREQSKSYEEIGAYKTGQMILGLDNSMPISGLRCTAGVLRSSGMKPMMGRLLRDTDETQEADPVAVISHSLWTRELASDSKAIGRIIRLDGRKTTIVGIMPPDFEFQSSMYNGHDIELWTPLVLSYINLPRGDHQLIGIGRLKDGVTIEAADAEIKTIGARLIQQYPDTNKFKPFQIISFLRVTTEKTSSGVALLLGAVTLLLLVACANVASLLMARGNRRQSEFGLRFAIGGSRGGIIRLLLMESLLLALMGSIVGILIAKWGLDIVRYMMPSMLAIAARRDALQLNGLVVAFSIGLSVVSIFFFGLLPAFMVSHTSVADTLKSDSRSQTGSRLRHRFLRYLVAGQIAVAMVLGNGAILLSTSYLKVLNDNRDLDTNQVLIAEIPLSGDRYQEATARQSFWQDLFERVRSLPGVKAVATTSKLPLEGGINQEILVDDEVYDPESKKSLTETSSVSSDYFNVMGITLICGRFIESEDSGQEINNVVINQTLAEKYWPGKNPIGRRIRSNMPEPWFRAVVVGVVTDVRQNAEKPSVPEIYFSKLEGGTLLVRTSGNARALIPSLDRIITSLDRDLPLSNVRTLKDLVGQSTSSRRFLTQLVGLFMGITLILTVVGVYGTLSYTVSQRQREIGIRMAMGAMRGQILRFVFRQAAVWVISGLVVGLFLTVGLSFLMRSAFYGVSPLNPLLLFIGLAFVSIAAGAACFLPARRASRMDPMEALRCE